ncbi:MAG: terminase large subunit [Candidimonas sp.]
MAELKQSMVDPIFFIENYITIKHPRKGPIPFHLFPYQREMINIYNSYDRAIFLTGRQLGKTETTVGYLLWYAMFNPSSNILIAANVYKQALEIMRRIRYAYESVPDYVKFGVRNYAKESIEFENGSMIQSQATTENTGRGLSISILYVDEFAFVPPNMAEAFWTSIQPTLSAGGKCFITSTPNSDVDQFSQIWRSANDTLDSYGNENPNGVGKNHFKAFKVTWDKHPERDEKWAEQQRSAIGDKKFEREHECAFISVDETLIDSHALYRMGDGDKPIAERGNVRFYEEILPNYTYLIGLDPSMGVGRDNAAIQVFRLPDMVQVAEWMHNETRVDGQIRVLLQIMTYIWNELKSNPQQQGNPDIYWTLENNSLGEASLRVVAETGEEKFPGEFIHEPFKRGSKRNRKGLHTTFKNKQIACSKLKSYIERDVMKIHSKALISELKNYVAKGMSFEGKPGVKDDLVSATLIVIRLIDIIQRWDPNFSDKLKDVIDLEDDDDFLEPMPVGILN